MPFLELKDIEVAEPVTGFRARVVNTAGMTVAHWEIDAGAVMPEHHHPNEQVVNVIDGEFELTVGGETRRMGPGSLAVIDPDVPHSGTAITACRIVDAFHPPRSYD
jgi:quercetin dioxygenase-like cupin family protein